MADWKKLFGRKDRTLPHKPRPRSAARRPLAGIELMEPRCVLSAAPIHVGMVYVEQDAGSDQHGDSFELTFSGGVEGTELKRVTVNGDQGIRGFSVGDVFFDVASTGLGGDHSFAFSLTNHAGIDSVRGIVNDGESLLVLEFEGFHAGDHLQFEIDVDEVEDWDPNELDLAIANEGFDPITSGVEFQGSQLTAEFSAAHYFDIDGESQFRNRYDDDLVESGLPLPADNEAGQRDRTAAAFILGLRQKPIPVDISGYVYHDRDDDGVRDAREEGIAGVAIQIVPIETLAEQSVLTVTTDASGFYEVTGIAAGTYRIIEIAQPEGYLDGRDSVGVVAGKPSGTASNDEIDAVFLAGGQAGTEYNFGELLPASLRGNVHLSTPDGDCFGTHVTHEPVAGARVILLDVNGDKIAETTTDAHGDYGFIGLRPGTYGVMEITPDGLLDGHAMAGRLGNGRVTDDGALEGIELVSGQRVGDYDFCEHVGATLSGHVYHDRDNDGVREAGEEGIGQVLVSLLDSRGVTVDTQRTDAAGRYTFRDVEADTYQVVETQPAAWIDGSDAPGTIAGQIVGIAAKPGDAIRDVRLRWGDTAINYDFGEFNYAVIRGRVQESTRDGDCFTESIEHAAIVNATVELLDAHGNVIAETVTNSNGEYEFTRLLPGVYGVREITPAGYLDGHARAGRNAQAIAGSVAADGSVRSIVLTSQDAVEDVLFCDHLPASITGFVYHDQDNNGEKAVGEQPIRGVSIELRDAAGIVVAQTTTDDEGRYAFTGLTAGQYSIREIQPAGYLDGLDARGIVNGLREGSAENPGDTIREIDLGWGDRGTDFNFGELLAGSISGLVHSDIVANCVFEPEIGEIGLEGVTVELLDANANRIATTVTDNLGQYQFEALPPGIYAVREVQPRDYFDGGQKVGSHGGNVSTANVIGEMAVGSNEHLTDYNFCEVPAATLSGFVFQDGDAIPLEFGATLPERIGDLRDGVRTPDDTMLPGVTLELRDGITGATVTAETHALPGRYPPGAVTVLTDSRGFYEFSGLRPGQYAVYQRQPGGEFIDGVDTPGTTSGFVFNPGEPQNESVYQQLTVDPQNDGIVRIGLSPGAVSQENNFSEVVVNQLPPERRNDLPFNPPSTPVPPARPPGFSYGSEPSGGTPGSGTYTPQPAGGGAVGERPKSWHLSIINGGQPRGDGVQTKREGSIWMMADTSRQATHRDLTSGVWSMPNGYGAETGMTMQELQFGDADAIPVSGDFNGDGHDEVGIYVAGEWFIDLNGNGHWDADDLWARLGTEKDLPVTGDWDGDGKWDIGIFGREWSEDGQATAAEPGLPDSDNETRDAQKNLPPDKRDATNRARLMRKAREVKIRADVIDHVFRFGKKGDVPVAGDWNGDGISSIGVYREGIWHLDVDGNGRWSQRDVTSEFGQEGDIPLVGDFNGDGVDDLAIFRGGVLIIDSNGNRELDAGDQRLEIGKPGDLPVVGDFNGDGKDEVAIYRGSVSPPLVFQARKAG